MHNGIEFWLRCMLFSLAGWVNQEQLKVIDYLKDENRTQRKLVKRDRIRLSVEDLPSLGADVHFHLVRHFDYHIAQDIKLGIVIDERTVSRYVPEGRTSPNQLPRWLNFLHNYQGALVGW